MGWATYTKGFLKQNKLAGDQSDTLQIETECALTVLNNYYVIYAEIVEDTF